MTDLEMTKLCAEAMGWSVQPKLLDEVGRLYRVRNKGGEAIYGIGEGWGFLNQYDPLHDDAQAMALVKRFRPIIDRDKEFWYVTLPINEGSSSPWQGEHNDLNRAIVECVAKMQAAGKGAPK